MLKVIDLLACLLTNSTINSSLMAQLGHSLYSLYSLFLIYSSNIPIYRIISICRICLYLDSSNHPFLRRSSPRDHFLLHEFVYFRGTSGCVFQYSFKKLRTVHN